MKLKFRIWSPMHELFWYIKIGDQFDFKATDVIEQYTGLKDKNNQEICEGDIVNVPPYRTISFNYPQERLKVIYDNDRFRLSGVADFAWYELEIIGNIHENNDLIDEEG